MNPWLERYAAALGTDPAPTLDREEIALVLDLAGAAARGAGARQFAPLATYLAGRVAAEADREARLALLRRAAQTCGSLGEASGPPDAG